ncbi:iron-containing alcohol dehydrogenase, partial [Listeria monocytogenes]|nr:iron-containing alcohol dehydrogenase [Listeria monocytogenes]
NRFNELTEVSPQDKKVLILYGGGSVERFGTLDKVKTDLKSREVGEFGGIEATPTYETLIKAIQLVKEENYDFLLAVGGGSVIDVTKFVASGALFDGEPMDIFGSGIGEKRPIT